MADLTDNLTFTYSDGGTPITVTVSISDGVRNTFNTALTANMTNVQKNWTCDVSELKSLVIFSDFGVTIETNDSGTPTDTITVTANKPVFWYTGCGLTCPITADVTTIYLTTGAGAGGTLRIRKLEDETPGGG